MIGDIMTISRLRMGTDGKGVTTLVTFFDCPLHCRYCINDFCHEHGDYVLESVPRGSYTPEQLMKILRKDEIYYLMSGGGVTFGGGEPLLQSAFIHEVCRLADQKWNMRIETSLNVPWRYVEPVIKDFDEWIIDIKETDPIIYKNYTGVAINQMQNNLSKIKQSVDPSSLHIRVPRIPGYNADSNIEYSVKWVRDTLGMEPEVFQYTKTLS